MEFSTGNGVELNTTYFTIVDINWLGRKIFYILTINFKIIPNTRENFTKCFSHQNTLHSWRSRDKTGYVCCWSTQYHVFLSLDDHRLDTQKNWKYFQTFYYNLGKIEIKLHTWIDDQPNTSCLCTTYQKLVGNKIYFVIFKNTADIPQELITSGVRLNIKKSINSCL